jgi:hypothetical protein
MLGTLAPKSSVWRMPLMTRTLRFGGLTNLFPCVYRNTFLMMVKSGRITLALTA